MKKIIFDGDGTLYDSGHGIKVSANYALKTHGYATFPIDKMDFFVGPPLYDCFRLCHVKEEDLDKVVTTYQTYQKENALYDLTLYDSVKKVLVELKQRGYLIYLGTSRRQSIGVDLLNHLMLLPLFDSAFGGSEDGLHCSKEDVIKKVMENTPVCEKSFMVGDTKFDILAGKKYNLKTIACLYGYGNKKEIEEAKPNFSISHFADILSIAL